MVYILNGTEGSIDNATCDWIKNKFILNIYLSCIYSEKSGNIFAPTIRVTCNSRLYTLEGAYEICHCFSHTSFPTHPHAQPTHNPPVCHVNVSCSCSVKRTEFVPAPAGGGRHLYPETCNSVCCCRVKVINCTFSHF